VVATENPVRTIATATNVAFTDVLASIFLTPLPDRPGTLSPGRAGSLAISCRENPCPPLASPWTVEEGFEYMSFLERNFAGT